MLTPSKLKPCVGCYFFLYGSSFLKVVYFCWVLHDMSPLVINLVKLTVGLIYFCIASVCGWLDSKYALH
uniref:Uncharacterized protein n=1 Tax=Arundo donax TaxID=35708 RepID=A0A0A9GMB6_ARUDO